MILILALVFQSCDSRYDVITEQSDGTLHKFICKDGTDTLNSIVHRFYGWNLISQWKYSEGKKEGLGIDYFQDGTISAMTNYRNDKPHGLSKSYNEDGILISKYSYISIFGL